MRPQSFTNDGAAALTGLDIRPFHRCDRRPQAEFTQRTKYLHVILKAALAQSVPGHFTGSVLADEFLSLGFGH